MTDLVIDSSVLLKWFHTAGESDVEASRVILDAHLAGMVECSALDLAPYEVGNVLLRSLRWEASRVRDVLSALHGLVGPGLRLDQAMAAEAVGLACDHGLTFYDAAWAAAARMVGAPLVTADRQLLAAGLGVTPSDAVSALRDGR